MATNKKTSSKQTNTSSLDDSQQTRSRSKKVSDDVESKDVVSSGPNAVSQQRAGAGAAKHRDPAMLKPGSSADDAKAVGGSGDFGAREGDAAQANYASRAVRNQDKGVVPVEANHPTLAGGDITSGAGMPASGDGGNSGGNLDPDIVGVGTGGSGIATSGATHRGPGPDDSDGSSDEFASGPHAKGENQTGVGKQMYNVDEEAKVSGSVVAPADDLSTGQEERGADAVNVKDDNDLDDSHAGEISSAEASGRDQAGR
jgi:hypothetical protein